MKCKNPGVIVFKGSYWECANCGSIDCAKEERITTIKPSWDKKCECGANKLLGEQNKHHAPYCDLYIKP